MLSRHRVSRAAIELIKRFEGYRRHAAQLPDGRWTIGYGHTLTARAGAEVSESDAEALLVYDLIAVQHAVNENTLAPLCQNQFDALCSFAFNIGIDNFRRSQVLKRLNAGAAVQAACAMELWRKADFEGERIVVDALVRRRSAEKALFLTPEDGIWTPAPSPMIRPAIDLDALDLVPMRRPVELETSLEGERVVVRREPTPEELAADELAEAVPSPEPTPAVSAMAEAVTGRLETLFPDPGEEPELEPDADLFEDEPDDDDLRPQADFAPPITTPAEAEPELESESESESESEPDRELSEPAADAELEIPQAPADAFVRPNAPDVAVEVAPYAFIPARPVPAARSREPSIIWDIVLGLLGLFFFGLGLFWGLATGGTPVSFVSPRLVGMLSGLAGIGFVVVAVYRLLQRLGRESERD